VRDADFGGMLICGAYVAPMPTLHDKKSSFNCPARSVEIHHRSGER